MSLILTAGVWKYLELNKWVVVEPMMIAIFILTGNYASAALYAVFEVFCILGVIKWRKESIS